MILLSCQRADEDVVRLSGWVTSPQEDELVRTIVDDYVQTDGAYDVEYNPIQANYIEKIQLMLGTGTAPDVFMLEAFWAPSLIEYDTLLPLNDLIDSSPEFGLQDFEPALLEAFTVDGKIYGIPKDYSTLVLFYDPDMLAEVGIERPPRTWAELAEAASRLTRDTDGDGRIDQYGFGLVDGLEYVLPFIWQNGVNFMGPDGRPNLSDPKVIEAVQFLQDLRRSGSAKLPSEVGAAWNMDGYGRERIAMTMSGLWAVNFLEETFPDRGYAMAPLPVGEVEQSIAYVVGYVIPKDTPDPQRAWSLLSYLTSKEGQAAWAEKGVGLPPRISIANEQRTEETAVFMDAAAVSRTWQIGKRQRILDETQSAMQAIFIQDRDVEEVFAELETRLERLFPEETLVGDEQ